MIDGVKNASLTEIGRGSRLIWGVGGQKDTVGEVVQEGWEEGRGLDWSLTNGRRCMKHGKFS